MSIYERVTPIRYCKTHANEIMRTLQEITAPIVVTQDIASYEKPRENLALLKILALGHRQVEQERVVSASEAFAGIRDNHLADA